MDKLPSVVSWTYTFLIVLVGWVFFRIEDFNKALSFVGVMFDFSNRDGISGFNFLNAENSSVLILAAIMSAPILARFKENKLSSSVLFIKNIGLILMFLYVVMAINFGSYNPFIYFKF